MAAFDVTRAGTILGVADVPRSLAFYRDVLGFQLDVLFDEPPYAILSRAGMRLSLAEQGHPAPDHEVVMTAPTDSARAQSMLVLEVADAHAIHEALSGAGAEIVAPLFSPPWGGHRFFVRDPDGFLIEIEELP
jgi:catechol 2,3-dioxygenase-like lactoylglutathione lyase family enzyme